MPHSHSDKRNSRPNAPVNVIVGALILKELNGLTDDEIIEECEFVSDISTLFIQPVMKTSL